MTLQQYKNTHEQTEIIQKSASAVYQFSILSIANQNQDTSHFG